MRNSIVAVTVALLLGFHASPISASPISPLTMSFDGGTMYYWDDYSEEDRVYYQEPYEGGYFFAPTLHVFGYEENGIYLDIDARYELRFGAGNRGKFSPTPPFNSVTFSLTSGGRFNLDSIFLVIASTVSRWDVGCVDDCGGISQNAEYRLTASNGAEFLFPTSTDYLNELLRFGKPFRGITSFTMTHAGWFPDDPVFGLNSISVTPVPAPTTLALLGLGLVGMGYARRRKANQLGSL